MRTASKIGEIKFSTILVKTVCRRGLMEEKRVRRTRKMKRWEHEEEKEEGRNQNMRRKKRRGEVRTDIRNGAAGQNVVADACCSACLDFYKKVNKIQLLSQVQEGFIILSSAFDTSKIFRCSVVQFLSEKNLTCATTTFFCSIDLYFFVLTYEFYFRGESDLKSMSRNFFQIFIYSLF